MTTPPVSRWTANSFRSQVAILTQGVRNANDGLSGLQIKDGALDNISKLLDRRAVLATQAATSPTTDDTRSVLNQEYLVALAEINRESAVAGLDAIAVDVDDFAVLARLQPGRVSRCA